RTQFVDKLDHHLTVTQAVESQATVGQAGLLAQGDQRLNHTAKFLRLGQRGFDDFMTQQRSSHVLEHGLTVAAGAIQLAKTIAVTHFLTPLYCAAINRAFRARPAASFPVSYRASTHGRPTLP